MNRFDVRLSKHFGIATSLPSFTENRTEEYMPYTPYITAHEETLKGRHYVIKARTDWYNLYPSKLGSMLSQYRDEFCLVINCSESTDEAYVLPSKDFAQYFSPEYLKENRRWFGHLRRDKLTIEPGHRPMIEVDIGPYYNAFHLLQDAPQPLPKSPEFL